MEGTTDYWNDRRLLWFEGDQLHVDAYVYADYRGMPEETPREQIEDDIHRFLGEIEIRWREMDLPF